MADKQDITRIPPQSIDSEKAVLGSMMQDNMAASRALELLSEDCFYLDAHRFIFRSMEELNDKLRSRRRGGDRRSYQPSSFSCVY